MGSRGTSKATSPLEEVLRRSTLLEDFLRHGVVTFIVERLEDMTGKHKSY
jgi:hypothetical protein